MLHENFQGLKPEGSAHDVAVVVVIVIATVKVIVIVVVIVVVVVVAILCIAVAVRNISVCCPLKYHHRFLFSAICRQRRFSGDFCPWYSGAYSRSPPAVKYDPIKVGLL